MPTAERARLTTRLATAADYAAFATLFPELAVADPLPTPEHFREQMLPRVVLALEGDLPVGYALRLAWSKAAALPVTDSVVTFVPTEADDGDIASRFDVDVARVALLRARPGTSLVALREGDAVVAFAAFDLGFPFSTSRSNATKRSPALCSTPERSFRGSFFAWMSLCRRRRAPAFPSLTRAHLGASFPRKCASRKCGVTLE